MLSKPPLLIDAVTPPSRESSLRSRTRSFLRFVSCARRADHRHAPQRGDLPMLFENPIQPVLFFT
jgi:hypothetical protein